jgi:hypothetical protein
MSRSKPPRVASWLLDRLASGPNRESLSGDLVEQWQHGRSATWYWRQVVVAIVMGATGDVWAHKLLAARTLVIGLGAQAALSSLLQMWWVPLDTWFWLNTPWKSEVTRELWQFYRLPNVMLACLGSALIGWAVGRLHARQRAAMLIFLVMSDELCNVWWCWEKLELLPRGPWPLWHLAILFHLMLAFVGYPLCVLVGGLWNRGEEPTQSLVEPAGH